MIYIDPPYNTLTGSFNYDDRRIDPDNTFVHSAWMSLMDKRLRLAHEVLADTGFILVSIDDNEEAALTLTMDGIFGRENRIAKFVWKKRGRFMSSTFVSVDTEYVLAYAKDISVVHFELESPDDQSQYKLHDEYYPERGGYQLLPLSMKLPYRPNLDYVITTPYGNAYPGGDETGYRLRQKTPPTRDKRVPGWRWRQDKLEWGLKNGYVVFKQGKDGTPLVYTKVYAKVNNKGERADRSQPWVNIIDFVQSRQGTKDLATIIGDNGFSFPKPVSLIRHFLRMAPSDARVLDFFAGSGTTGQAVLEANRDDGGSRTFVLATNNENGICENVTYPRLRNVIQGYRKGGKPDGEEVPGIHATLRYLRAEVMPKGTDAFATEAALMSSSVIPCGFAVGDLSVPIQDTKVPSVWHIGQTADVCVDAEMEADPEEVISVMHAPVLFLPEWICDYVSDYAEQLDGRTIKYLPRAVFGTSSAI